MSAMTLIQHLTVGAGGASSIDFNSIPNTFDDLVIQVSIRAGAGTDYPGLELTFNSSGSGYSFRNLFGNGSSASSFPVSLSAIRSGNVPGSGQTANTFGSISVYVPNYRSSAAKSVSIDAVAESNTTFATQEIIAGLWNNSAVISSVRLGITGFTLAQHSSASLYGITRGTSSGVTVS